MKCLQRSFWGRMVHVMAVLMLVVSGGVYAHAGAHKHDHDHGSHVFAQAAGTGPLQPHTHLGVTDDEAGSKTAMLHCGADIHFPAVHAPVFGTSVSQVICAEEPDALDNALMARDPPPPRLIS